MFVFLKNLARYIRVLILRTQANNSQQFSTDANILIVAPHPDDEIIGCAGLIQQCLNNGQSVNVVILTGGSKSHCGCCDLDENTIVENRKNLSRKAAEILGLSLRYLYFLDYTDGAVVFDCSETDQLKQLIDDLQPDSIFVPHKGEGWSDHIEAGNIIRELIADKNEIRLYEYCVWFWFYNCWRINWKDTVVCVLNKHQYAIKLKAIDAYIEPKAPCGEPWSGVLPPILLWANKWNKELFFQVK